VSDTSTGQRWADWVEIVRHGETLEANVESIHPAVNFTSGTATSSAAHLKNAKGKQT